jgi:hypothetical protein
VKRLLLAVIAVAVGFACGKDPVSYSSPVGISLDARSGDVTAGQLAVTKNINTETGNPYGAFTNAAVQALGRAPSRITVTGATLSLEPTSSGVTVLEQVLGAGTTLAFQMNASGGVYRVATIAQATGTGPVPMDVSLDSAPMPPGDYADLVGGSFKVLLTGPAAAGFAAAGGTARMEATLTFVAWE